MTITLERAPCDRGTLISIDGVTGVGKTYLTTRAVEPLDDPPLILDGFSQRPDGQPGLGETLLRGLRDASSGHPFLSGGTPLAEALLLLAIKRHDLDTVIPELTAGRTVVEGRSVDSTAVCQALQLHPDDPDAALRAALDLLDLAASYRPLPDITILVTDDAHQAVARAERRDQRTFTADQTAFLHDASTLFERLAATDPVRYRVVDRRTIDDHAAVELIKALIVNAPTALACVPEPWRGPQAPCMYCGRTAESAPA